MTKVNYYRELAKEIALLKEPSRQIDSKVHLAIHYKNFTPTEDEVNFGIASSLPRYTENSDDAMSIVHPECGYTFTRHPQYKSCEKILPVCYDISVPRVGGFHTNNPAMAYTWAALSWLAREND